MWANTIVSIILRIKFVKIIDKYIIIGQQAHKVSQGKPAVPDQTLQYLAKPILKIYWPDKVQKKMLSSIYPLQLNF